MEKEYILKKELLTITEKKYYYIIKETFKEYEVLPQIALSSIIEKIKNFKNEYQNELNKVIDIGIFEKQTLRPLLLIEINDKSHLNFKRTKRDAKLLDICNNAGIKLIFFWIDENPTKIDIISKIIKNL